MALSLVMHVPILGLTPLSGTEGHRALTAHQMVESHQWLVPMLFGRPYLAKPPFHYWLIAVFETLAQRGNVFVWRLPSALSGSAVCAVVALMATRWFGRTQGFVAGLCAVGMICFWGECQVADIDATNRLMATLAAVCGIELYFGHPRRKWLWALFGGLAIGATLMTKGPGGIPIIAGVWICAAVDAVLQQRRSSERSRPGVDAAAVIEAAAPADSPNSDPPSVLEYRGHHPKPARQPQRRAVSQVRSPLFWGPVAMGTIILLVYGLAVYESLRHRKVPIDPTGVIEGSRSLYASSLSRMLKALVLPAELIAYALPVSLSLPMVFVAPIKHSIAAPGRRIAMAIVAAVLVSWGVCFASGMVNVRYAYPTLPLLCPLAGAVAVAAAQVGGMTAEWLRRIVAASAVMLVGAAVGLAYFSWKRPGSHVVLLIAVGLALACLAAVLVLINRGWRAAWGLAALALLASVPFSLQRDYARTATSGIYPAAVVRDITGPGAAVEFGMAVFYKPEIFYYAGVNARAMLPAQFKPSIVPAGTWVFLSTSEYNSWRRNLGPRLTRITLIAHTNEDDFYLAWYAPAAPPPG